MKVSCSSIIKVLYNTQVILYPQAKEELKNWLNIASQASDIVAQKSAKEAISRVKVSIVETCAPLLALKSHKIQEFLPISFIVAYKTLYTYLEIFCTDTSIKDFEILNTLYCALIEAINPDVAISDYYKKCHNKNDGGFLNGLVKTCRNQVYLLPSYKLVKEFMLKYTRAYIDLQIVKFSSKKDISITLASWSKDHQKDICINEELQWWEFCSAIDSQVIIPILFVTGANEKLTPENLNKLVPSFFPWMGGFIKILNLMVSVKGQEHYHKLELDQDLDLDLNHAHDHSQYLYLDTYKFIDQYAHLKEVEQRLIYFYSNAVKILSTLDYAFAKKYYDVISLQTGYILTNPVSKFGMNKLATTNIINHINNRIALYIFMLQIQLNKSTQML